MSVSPPKTIVITTFPKQSTTTGLTVPVSSLDNMEDLYTSDGAPRKRRRLTHLTPEEKLLRRKLKNRVAAQSARDRKKTLMEQLEHQVASLIEENKKLATENNSLKVKSGALIQENETLKERLGAFAKAPVMREQGPGSAVSSVPLPKGQVSVRSHWMRRYVTSMLTVSLTLLLACSNRQGAQRKSQESFSCHAQKGELPNQPRPQVQWWGPQQQSWNPSMN